MTTQTTVVAGDFADLVNTLSLLKAFPAEEPKDAANTEGVEGDDKRIAAAAKEAGADKNVTGDGTDGDGKTKPEDEDLMKAFEITLADGTKMEALDGAALIKALNTRLESAVGVIRDQYSLIETLQKRLVSQGAALRSELSENRVMLKALQTQVAAIGKEGTGRRSTLSVLEPVALSGAQHQQDDKPKPVDILNKALSLQSKGTFNAIDVSRVQAYVNRGLAVPDDLMRHIQAA